MDSSSLPEEPLQGQGSSNASSQMILRLRQIRTSYMGHLGKLRIEVDSLNLNETEERLRVLVGRLSNYTEKLRDVNGKLMDLVDPDDMEHECTVEDEISTRVLQLEVELNKRLSSRAPSPSSSRHSSPSSSSCHGCDYGLPKLTLPQFDGSSLQFRSFWDQFRAAVGDRQMPAVQKLSYLLSCLKGDARSALAGISCTAENYAVAVKILTDRFGDPSFLIGLYADRLVNLSPAKGSDLSSFRALIDGFEAALREIRGLIKEVVPDAASNSSSINVHDILLAPILTGKLPRATQLEWVRRSSTPQERFSLDKLLSFAKRELESQEAIAQANNRSTVDKQGNRRLSSTLVTCGQNERAQTPDSPKSPIRRPDEARSTLPQCRFCPQGTSHRIFVCPTFNGMSFAQRDEAVRKARLCFNCLSQTHSKSVCPSQMSCRHCGKRHHSLLHRSSNQPSDVASHTNTAVSSPSRRAVLQTALVHVDGHSRPVRVMLDTGAERSYVTESLVRIVNPPLVGRSPHRIETFGGNVTEVQRSLYRINLSSRDRSSTISVKVIAVPKICSPSRGFSRALLDGLEGFVLADELTAESLPIDILLGMDSLPSVVVLEPPVKRGSLLLTPTVFGYVLGGTTGDAGDPSLVSFAKVLRAAVDPPVSSLWDLDTVGVSSNETISKHSVQPLYTGDRYEVGLPWQDDRRPSLTCEQAMGRLRNQHHLSPERRDQYAAVFHEYENLGILEPTVPHGGNFIPHHGVKQKGKIRVVYDASAKAWHGPSLNDCLYSGENLLADLTAVLLRFRIPQFPLIGDIEKAFLMVGVHDADRDYLKIVWYGRDGQTRFSRFRRVPFGINCGPYLLLRTIHHHLDQQPDQNHPSVCTIRESLYMDDLIGGADDICSVLNLKEDAVRIFREAGMNLRGFISIPHVHRFWSPDPPSPTKVLGLPWSPEDDVISVPMFLGSARTRREVLSAVAQIFDPIGLLSPWLIGLKRFLQSLWASSESRWDDPMDADQQQLWETLVRDASSGLHLSVPRRITMTSKTEIFAFADASPHAYAAVIYLRSNGSSSLLISRARVAPLKPSLTVPRLELMAALFAARLTKFALNSLRRLDLPVRYYSGSMIVLGWIRNPPSDVFVRNRVREILQLSSEDDWQHIPGKENPADLATRGMAPADLIDAHAWLQPSLLETVPPIQCYTVTVTIKPTIKQDFPIAIENFSNLNRLLRVLCWIRRYLFNLKHTKRMSGLLTEGEIKESRLCLLRAVQSSTPEYEALSGGREPSPWSSLWDARPSIDPVGILLCNPRTHEPPLPWLPCPSVLADLVIDVAHRKLYHMGVSSTVAELRRSYWVPKCRSAVRKVIGRCAVCRRVNARRLVSDEGPLPDFRSVPARPFDHVGLDHFGPLRIRDGSKVWGFIFTCAITRAIHLEAVSSLDVRETSLAIRRFIARRGLATFWISDNARSFSQLAKGLRGLVTWRFIPPSAPWWGGFWERMVGTVKRACKKTLGSSSLSFVELQTVLTEVEDRINRRPLTTVEDGDVLTPAHFLFGASPPPLEAQYVCDQQPPPLPTPEELSRHLQHRLRVSSHLWSRWRNEYLTSLRNWRTRNRKDSRICVGDVVLISPPDGIKIPRSAWPLGLVTKLFPGADGVVRAVELRVNGKITRRPLSRLCLLEVQDTSTLQVTHHGSNAQIID